METDGNTENGWERTPQARRKTRGYRENTPAAASHSQEQLAIAGQSQPQPATASQQPVSSQPAASHVSSCLPPVSLLSPSGPQDGNGWKRLETVGNGWKRYLLLEETKRNETVRLNNHRKRIETKRPGSGRNGPKRLLMLRKRVEPKQPGRGNESKRNGQVKETKRTETERNETNSFLIYIYI